MDEGSDIVNLIQRLTFALENAKKQVTQRKIFLSGMSNPGKGC